VHGKSIGDRKVSGQVNGMSLLSYLKAIPSMKDLAKIIGSWLIGADQ